MDLFSYLTYKHIEGRLDSNILLALEQLCILSFFQIFSNN